MGTSLKSTEKLESPLEGFLVSQSSFFGNKAHFVLKDSQDPGKLHRLSNSKILVTEIVHPTTLRKEEI